jgi:hypothetical protein
LYNTAQNFSWEEVRTAETGQVRKFGEQMQPVAATICIIVLGSDFMLVMVGLSYQSWLSFLDALTLVGYWFSFGIILCQG